MLSTFADGSTAETIPNEEYYLRRAIVEMKGALNGGEPPNTLEDLYRRHALTVDEMAQAALLAIRTAVDDEAGTPEA